jgi:hypothetical protein
MKMEGGRSLSIFFILHVVRAHNRSLEMKNYDEELKAERGVGGKVTVYLNNMAKSEFFAVTDDISAI